MRVLTLFVGVLLLFGVLSSAQADLPSVPEGVGFEAGLQGPTPQNLHHIQKRSLSVLARLLSAASTRYFNGIRYYLISGRWYSLHRYRLYTKHADEYIHGATRGGAPRMTQTVVDDILNRGKCYVDVETGRFIVALERAGGAVLKRHGEEPRGIKVVISVLTPEHVAKNIGRRRFRLTQQQRCRSQ